MKVTSTSSQLSLLIDAFNTIIAPECVSPAAIGTVEIIKATLSDLLKRQGPGIELLERSIKDGEKLDKEINHLAGGQKGHAKAENAKLFPGSSFDTLATHHGELTERLVKSCVRLSQSNVEKSKATKILRKAAEWEVSYFTESNKLQVTPWEHTDIPQEPSVPSLTLEYLQDFVNSRHGSVEVVKFNQLLGGYGKQTYLATLKDPNGTLEDIIIRKADATPIIQQGCYNIEQEFELLKALETTDLPLPHPRHLGHQLPNIDGSFYTMGKLPGAVPSNFLTRDDKKYSEKLLLRLAELLAKLHCIPLDTFGGYFEKFESRASLHETIEERYRRNLEGWRQYQAEFQHLPSTYSTWLFEWLEENLPKDSRSPVLLHGDYNIHNMLAEDDDITGILDWECSDFGAPELDLAYIQPLISKHIDWQRFLDHYEASGGPKIDPSIMPWCQTWTVMRTLFAFNRATMNLQTGVNRDIRFLMVSFGYMAAFMGMALSYTSPEAGAEAIEDTPETNGHGQSHNTNGNGHNRETNDNGDEHSSTTKTNGTAKESSDGSSENAKASTGGQNLERYTNAVHVRQKPGPEKNWQDSVVLVWWDETNSIGGFHRLGHEPNAEHGGKVVLWTNLISPAGHFKRTHYKPLRQDDLLENGGFGGGDNTCRSEFIDGEHIWTINEPEEGVSARLVFKDVGPNVDCFPKRGAISEEFATHHFDIPGEVSGTLEMKGKTYEIRGLGLRDHGWGPRDWTAVYSHRWVVGTCGKELSFVAVSWHNVDESIANFGWVVRGEEVTLAKKLDIVTYTEIDGAMNRGGHVQFTLTTGEVLEIECTPVKTPGVVCYHHGITCIDVICTFSCNGLRGFCDFENSSNIAHGTRKPKKFVNGIIDEGFTPIS